MFGYINANYRELTTEQREKYQSYYCGLCRELQRNCGKKGQMLLNYDMTFLVILLTGLYEPVNIKEEFTCALHPLKKKTSRTNEASEYAAKMNILLAYHNFKDDWQDERSLYKRCLMSLLEKDYQKVKEEYPRQAQAVERALERLAVAESGRETNLDAVSGITGEMLAEIFNWKDDHWAEELRCMGFYMGKFIYLMDAYQDLKKDEKNGVYNPFIYVKEENRQGMELDTYVRLILNSMMTECAKSFERLPIVNQTDLLRNILYSGVWTKYEAMQIQKEAKQIQKEEKKKKENNQEKDERSI